MLHTDLGLCVKRRIDMSDLGSRAKVDHYLRVLGLLPVGRLFERQTCHNVFRLRSIAALGRSGLLVPPPVSDEAGRQLCLERVFGSLLCRRPPYDASLPQLILAWVAFLMVPLHFHLPHLQRLPPRLPLLRPRPRLHYRCHRQMAQTIISVCLSRVGH
jgi:hypothetical protein